MSPKNLFLKVGLTSQEAAQRLKEHGPNELLEKSVHSSWQIFLDQFASPLIYMLLFAGLVTLFLKEFTDSIVIFAAVSLNTILGFFQENKAQKALQALAKLLVLRSKVIRDGRVQLVNTIDLVPGDLVILEIGTSIPADGVLIEANDLSLNEAILTGESEPVSKKVTKLLRGKNISIKNLQLTAYSSQLVFAGTTVSTGIGKMIITQTGNQTKMGQISLAVTKVGQEKTPLQIQLASLARIIAIAAAFICLSVFLIGIWQKREILSLFTISVAVAVAANPEGLVITLTVILAIGMQRILAQKALVRKLLSAETLGSVSVICADKTGTLTEGKMKVTQAETLDLEMLNLVVALCNDLRDPLEHAMWDWLKERGFNPQQIVKKNPRLDSFPFSPHKKYIVTLNQVNFLKKPSQILFISGAPEVILAKCSLDSSQINLWQEKFSEFGQKGLRIVGFAYKPYAFQKISPSRLNQFQWLGILIYEDPLRKGIEKVFRQIEKAGIALKVITGDYPKTAIALMRRMGYPLEPDQVLTGNELAVMSEDQLKEKVKQIVLFARTDPSQKLKIVSALKENGESVAMMGDGVNDAPALAKADIGIVVNNASDVARETADIVLLDSRFETIVSAIKEGRIIFENIKKVILYLLSDGFTEVALVGGSMLLGLPLPVTASQILWVNLIEDTVPNVALAFESEGEEIMNEPPRPRHASILSHEIKMMILIFGIITNISLLGLTYLIFHGFFHFTHLQTVIFVSLGIDSLFYVFSCRSLKKSIFSTNLFENKALLASVVIGWIMLLGAVYFPPLQILLKTQGLNWQEWIFIIFIGVFNLAVIEFTKWFFILRKKRSQH